MGQAQSADGDVEGSARERFLENPTLEERSHAPLLDGSCPFLEQSLIVVETICYYLPPSSLSSLSQTCSLMNNMVGEFLRHSCSPDIIRSCEERFLVRTNRLTTLYERQLIASMASQLESEENMTRQDMMSLMKAIEHYSKYLVRISVADQRVDFPHRSNPDYVGGDGGPTTRQDCAAGEESEGVFPPVHLPHLVQGEARAVRVGSQDQD